MWFQSYSPRAKKGPRARPSLEVLEDRLAPAGVLTYTDIDGDTVTISSTKGNAGQLSAAANFSPPIGFGKQLHLLDLGNNPVFRDTDLTITAIKADVTGDGIKEGDGLVNVGHIRADVDLDTVRVKGDLGKIASRRVDVTAQAERPGSMHERKPSD